MVHGRFVRVVAIVVSTGLSVLIAGCGAQITDAGSSMSDPAASIAASQLNGIWVGSFHQIGGSFSNSSGDRQGNVALEIKGDATYTLTSTRRGVTSRESGIVVANERRVSLNSSSGWHLTLMHNGDALYGVSVSGHFFHPSGYPIQIGLRRASGAASGSDSQSALPRFAPDAEGSRSAPAPDPFQAP